MSVLRDLRICSRLAWESLVNVFSVGVPSQPKFTLRLRELEPNRKEERMSVLRDLRIWSTWA